MYGNQFNQHGFVAQQTAYGQIVHPTMQQQRTGFQPSSLTGQYQQPNVQMSGYALQEPQLDQGQSFQHPQYISQGFGQTQGQAEAQYTQGNMMPQQTGFPVQPVGFGGYQNQNATQGVAGEAASNFGKMAGVQSQQLQQPQNSAHSAPLKPQKTGASIPHTRLSFVTAQDQQKFEGLFATAVGQNEALSGDAARTILMRSNLPAHVLSNIWNLADTTKSGQLLFPEFVLAMHLCNQAISGKPISDRLDERTKNEVSGIVDQILFGLPDSNPAVQQSRTNVPSFVRSTPAGLTANQSNMGLVSQLQPAMTGYQGNYNALATTNPGSMQAQFPQPPQMNTQQTIQMQRAGYQPGVGMQPGLTGVQQPGVTGLQHPRTSALNQMQTYQTAQDYSASIDSTGQARLTSQPTGKPGQWGYVNTPAQYAAQGLPGISAMSAQMMPQSGVVATGGYSMSSLQGNAQIPWAITREEKAAYDSIFQAWDRQKRGFVDGPTAIEVFGQSGIPRSDLELIW